MYLKFYSPDHREIDGILCQCKLEHGFQFLLSHDYLVFKRFHMINYTLGVSERDLGNNLDFTES